MFGDLVKPWASTNTRTHFSILFVLNKLFIQIKYQIIENGCFQEKPMKTELTFLVSCYYKIHKNVEKFLNVKFPPPVIGLFGYALRPLIKNVFSMDNSTSLRRK